MSSKSGKLVVDSKLINEGTSLFVEETGEVAWIAEIGSDHVRVETLTSAFEMRTERVVKRIKSDDFVVQSRLYP